MPSYKRRREQQRGSSRINLSALTLYVPKEYVVLKKWAR